MEFAVKRFARNVLLLHLLLLLVVLALMLFASKAIREGAREQAQKQAESRQRIIAARWNGDPAAPGVVRPIGWPELGADAVWLQGAR